jgi:hypothetical protein
VEAVSVPIEAVESIVRWTELSKEEIFALINDWAPEVSDEELERMWRSRPQKVVVQ